MKGCTKTLGVNAKGRSGGERDTALMQRAEAGRFEAVRQTRAFRSKAGTGEVSSNSRDWWPEPGILTI